MLGLGFITDVPLRSQDQTDIMNNPSGKRKGAKIWTWELGRRIKEDPQN